MDGDEEMHPFLVCGHVVIAVKHHYTSAFGELQVSQSFWRVLTMCQKQMVETFLGLASQSKGMVLSVHGVCSFQ
jgi:hypothetical protein